MVTRRAGGPPDRPYRVMRRGVNFRVFGVPYKRPVTIQVINIGTWRRLFTDQRLGRKAKESVMQRVFAAMLRNTPIDTGKSRTSTRFRRGLPRVTQGATPQGKKPGNYSRIANRRSKRASGFIERSITEGTVNSLPTLRRMERLRTNVQSIERRGKGREILNNV